MQHPNEPGADHVLQFFEFEHLPDQVRATSKQFHDLAHEMHKQLPHNTESWMCLRWLLHAKDCAVRAKLYK